MMYTYNFSYFLEWFLSFGKFVWYLVHYIPMPISYPSGSFDCWPGFLVCPSPNRNSFPFHESMKPHIWSFESFHLVLISVFLLFHVFQHFSSKVGARDRYTNFTKLSEFPYKSFFRFGEINFTCFDYSCFSQIGHSQGHEVADLTEEEIKALEKKEEKLQKQIKKRELQAKDKAIRERAKKRARNLLKKPTI